MGMERQTGQLRFFFFLADVVVGEGYGDLLHLFTVYFGLSVGVEKKCSLWSLASL